MSKKAIDQVLLKASSDERFRKRLNSNFDAAIKGYDLTAAEKAKLRATAGSPEEGEMPAREAATRASNVRAAAGRASASRAAAGRAAASRSVASRSVSARDVSS